MYSPYRDQQGLMWVSDQTVAGWTSLENKDLRLEAFKEFVLSIDKPFEFWGMIFNNCGDNFMHLFPDHRSLILDLIAQNYSRWKIDEVVCFLLEVIDDHPFLADKALSCLKLIRNIDLKNLEYAGGILVEWLDQDYHDEVVNALYEANSWKLAIIELLQRIGDANFSQIYKDIFIEIGIEILRKEVPVNVYKYAELLTKGYKLFDEEHYLEAIESINGFYSVCPTVFPDKVSMQIANCFLRLGWNGTALQWATRALNHSPNLQDAKDLQKEILAPYSDHLERIKREFARPHWTSDYIDVFATTELLFRSHGQIMGDYGGIVNGYGRAVETQLQQGLLPKVRMWIKQDGLQNSENDRFYIWLGKRKVFGDEPGHKFNLGRWKYRLKDKEAYKKVDTKGEFFHCAAKYAERTWGYVEWSQRLSELGELLDNLRVLRNKASNKSFREWSSVETARQLCLQILEGIAIKDGNLIG